MYTIKIGFSTALFCFHLLLANDYLENQDQVDIPEYAQPKAEALPEFPGVPAIQTKLAMNFVAMAATIKNYSLGRCFDNSDMQNTSDYNMRTVFIPNFCDAFMWSHGSAWTNKLKENLLLWWTAACNFTNAPNAEEHQKSAEEMTKHVNNIISQFDFATPDNLKSQQPDDDTINFVIFFVKSLIVKNASGDFSLTDPNRALLVSEQISAFLANFAEPIKK